MNSEMVHITHLIKTRLPVLTVLAWIVLYTPRIWQFGFLQGDWEIMAHWANGGLLSKWALMNAFITFLSRPVMIPVYGLFPGFIGFRPWIWQSLSASLCLLIGLKIYRIFQNLNSSSRYSFSSDLMTGIFLASPWTLGFTGWPTLLMGLVALYFFLKAGEVIITNEFSRGQVIKSSLYYLLSLLSYEAFFLQFLFLPLLRLFKKSALNRVALTESFWIGLGFSVAILLSAVFNRIIFFFEPLRTTKPINDAWLFTELKPAIYHFWGNVTSGIVYYREIFQYLAIGFVALGTLGLILSLLKKKQPTVVVLLLVALFVCLLLSIALYGIAGYSVIGSGTLSRTTIAVSLLLVMYLFVTFELIREYVLLRFSGLILLVALLALSMLNLQYQQKIWSLSWKKLIEVVRAFPIDQLPNVPHDSVLVYVGETNFKGFEYVGNLELTAAIATIYPESRIPLDKIRNSEPRSYPKDVLMVWAIADKSVPRLFYVKGQGQVMRFDGTNLSQELPGHWQFTYPAKNVFVWKRASSVNSIEQCLAPCELR